MFLKYFLFWTVFQLISLAVILFTSFFGITKIASLQTLWSKLAEHLLAVCVGGCVCRGDGFGDWLELPHLSDPQQGRFLWRGPSRLRAVFLSFSTSVLVLGLLQVRRALVLHLSYSWHVPARSRDKSPRGIHLVCPHLKNMWVLVPLFTHWESGESTASISPKEKWPLVWWDNL